MLPTCSRTYLGRLSLQGKSITSTTPLTLCHCRLPSHFSVGQRHHRHCKPPPPPICCGTFPIRRVAKALYSTMATNYDGGGGWGRNGSEHTVEAWFAVPELSLRDHRFIVPLDYSSGEDDGIKITVFAREVVGAGKEELPLPYLLFLQGGPGYESPRPNASSGWLKKACEEYRVILLDQRGTGLSTPLTTSSLSQFTSSEKMADYLTHFRADNIVRDAEFIRKCIVPESGTWTVIGQSYGGFTAVTYLSFAPDGLKSVLLTGGLPPIANNCTADAVYRACFENIVHQNKKYYKRFPQDISVVKELVQYLNDSEGGGVPLPSGGILTPMGLQILGLSGLGSYSGFENLHYMFERIWDPVLVPGAPKKISFYFLTAFERWLGFDTNPIYALLHESCYCQGAASKWSAHKIRNELGSLFDPVKATQEDRPVFFTGEMVFPWMFDEIHALKHLKEAANLLAEKKNWPQLYDVTALNKNQVPVAAAVYYEDMYVNFKLSMETASQIAGIRLWVNNEFMHSGLRDNGDKVFEQLMGMLKGKKPLF